ncbi:hypothetical protein BaRGS_00001470 [Batillaria attramentaria]|uniref:Ig-like domain-containing protein n=1 Tax=Batillaria attramentaria TaxID=370345 RepID=A0ABD0M738_9CAEN
MQTRRNTKVHTFTTNVKNRSTLCSTSAPQLQKLNKHGKKMLLEEHTEIPESEETAAPLVAKDEVTVTLEGLEAPTTESMAPETEEVTAVETIAEKPIETEEVSHEFVIRETAEAVSLEETQEEITIPESEKAAPEVTTAESFQTLITEIEEAFAEDYTQQAPIIEEEEELPKPSVSGVPVTEPEAPVEEEGFVMVELPETKDVQEEIVEERPTGEAPKFLQPLQNVEATEGQTVRFETTVSGFPRPEVSWFLDGEPIKESPVYRIITEASGTCILELPQSFPEDEGEYECRATNEYGTTSIKADLYIQGQHSSVS